VHLAHEVDRSREGWSLISVERSISSATGANASWWNSSVRTAWMSLGARLLMASKLMTMPREYSGSMKPEACAMRQ
jgi:hypothetical protein